MKNTNNFLNNQKYIFWKSEKIRILALFLSEIRIKNILTVLSKWRIIWFWSIIPWIYIIGMYYTIIEWTFYWMDLIIFGGWFLFFWIWSIFLTITSFKNVKTIEKMSDYFFIKEDNDVILVTISTILTYSTPFLLFLFLIRYTSLFLDKTFIVIYIIFVLFYFIYFFHINKYRKIKYYFDILNIIFFPFMCILSFFVYFWNTLFLKQHSYQLFKSIRKEKNLFKDYYEVSKQ